MKTGDRVQLHPATDDWMRGDRFGEVVGFGRSKNEYIETFRGPRVESGFRVVRPVLVKLDVSGKTKRFHPDDVLEV